MNREEITEIVESALKFATESVDTARDMHSPDAIAYAVGARNAYAHVLRLLEEES